ncbi:hypothetical protein EV363DRAFT_1397763 [Boletus edulis]|nr:hypothetical protein EV363DRAFT_1397763 [Boletus edulis]
MSSSGYHPSTHLHRVNIHPHGKRPFEECGGYDSDPDTSMPIHPTTSGTSSSSNNNRFPTTTSSTGLYNPEARNKRARSTSSSSIDDSSSNPSSSSGYNTAQSSSRSDISSDGPSALPTNTVDCPIHPVASPPSFVATHDVHMSDLHLPIPPTQPQRPHVPTPSIPEDTLRTSLQRFAEFDRQIAALRTSLAATRSSPLPSLGPSVDGDPIPSNDHWHSDPPNFLSNGSSSLPPSTTSDPASSAVAVAPSETLNSLSTFASSNVLILQRQPQLHPVAAPLRRSLPLIVMSLAIHPILLIAPLLAAHRLPHMIAWEMSFLPVLRLLSSDRRPPKILRDWARDRRSLSSCPHTLPLPTSDTHPGACPR